MESNRPVESIRYRPALRTWRSTRRRRPSERALTPVATGPHIVPPPRAERARSIAVVRNIETIHPVPLVREPAPLVRAPWVASEEGDPRQDAPRVRQTVTARIAAAPVLGSRRERREAERRLAERGLVLPVA